MKDAKNERLFQGSLDVGLGFQALEKPMNEGLLTTMPCPLTWPY